MPEDALIGFRFFSSSNSPTIVNEAAERNATQHLENDIAHFHAIQHLDRATDAVQAAATRNDRRDEPGFEDNVPPDLIGPDDFLL
ncbi:hypothetical protein RXV86_01140 [Alisedimentitalea sp. MJ-SS2]|uniref:hypothetical protein n=1 Tax=Aliisedimentitalea sp. MJ-SS2 TaxID=3049795 RepID=UPI002914AE89|nr:hypothetical protein [Alisedimentitalea sp. MJ-SS2]MDU8925979.1 hypothetical protein [Alisedimentitalea sp. MJ-SS2]